MFAELLARLRTLEMFYKTAHWTAKNSVFYGDHQLFDRLSDEAGEHIDAVAEKSIGVTGSVDAVNLQKHLALVSQMCAQLPSNAPENVAFAKSALPLEQSLLEFCKAADASDATLGTKNLVQDIADAAEGRIYLLKQRIASK